MFKEIEELSKLMMNGYQVQYGVIPCHGEGIINDEQYRVVDTNKQKVLFESNKYKEGTFDFSEEEVVKDVVSKLYEIQMENEVSIIKDADLMLDEITHTKIQANEEQTPHLNDRYLEIKNAPAVEELCQYPNTKDLYNAYARETLSAINEIGTEKADKMITASMLGNGVKEQRVNAALRYSIAFTGLNDVTTRKRIKETITSVKQTNPDIKQLQRSGISWRISR